MVFQKLKPTNLMLFVQEIYIKRIECISIDINYLELALFCLNSNFLFLKHCGYRF